MSGRGHPSQPLMMPGRGHPHLPHPAMMMQMQMMQHNHFQQQQQVQQQQQQQQQQKQRQQQVNNQTPQKNDINNTKQSAKSTPKPIDKKLFKKIDFPALGADDKEIEKERNEEETKIREEKEKKKKVQDQTRSAAKRTVKSVAAAAGANEQRVLPTVRITFQDPSPGAPPVHATSIPSTSMTSRDLCHVLHSIMRPLLTFENVLDAYNADYYHWSYNDRKSRNLFNNNIPGNNMNLPNPVWKETKIKAQALETKFRDTVEKRANEWSKEKQALGKMAKANVKRPRALLATNALSSTAESRVTSGLDLEDEQDEYKQRAILWAARVGIDKGYLAYLNLAELRRLLQSQPGDVLGNMDESETKREYLLHDVEENVGKLDRAFGVGKDESGNLVINSKVLSRTLSLPKGRMLLSRVVDEGILPHSSACQLLSFAIKSIIQSASNADLTAAPPAGEDRLLRSLSGLVRTVQPSVDITNLIACLSSAIDTKASLEEKNKSMKNVLAGKRTLMELLHAIFTRGGEICTGEFEGDWKAKESQFLLILSGQE
jgi:hypothetical protein